MKFLFDSQILFLWCICCSISHELLSSMFEVMQAENSGSFYYISCLLYFHEIFKITGSASAYSDLEIVSYEVHKTYFWHIKIH
jgi:hypothetical protein